MKSLSLATITKAGSGPFAAILFFLSAPSPAAAPTDPFALNSWTCRAGCTNIPDDSLNLYNVRFLNGMFMAVGDGVIITSTNGTNWADQGGAGLGVLRDVAFGNGTYVAVGGARPQSPGSGVILTSPDGVTWTPQTIPVTNSLEAVTFANGLFVAVGGLGIILTSTDGSLWVDRSITSFYFLADITFGNGRFVAAANSAIGVTSPDGVSWTITNSDDLRSTLNAIAFGDGLFVGVGSRDSESNYVFTSTDGIAWAPRATTTNNSYLQAVAFGAGGFVAGVSRGAFLISSNGFTWTLLPSAGLEQHIEGVAFGNGIFVAVKAEQVGVSSDTVNWTWQTSPRRPAPPNFSAITFGQGRFVVVGNGSNVFSSTDGANWSPHPIGRSLGLNSIIYGNDRFVAVGDSVALAVSLDGTSWTGDTLGGDLLHEVAFGNGVFVAAGSVYTHRSTNGYQWWYRSAPGIGFDKRILFANGWFYLIGQSLSRSIDGSQWEIVLPSYLPTYGFAFGQGQLVHISSGIAGASLDGSNWVSRSFPGMPINALGYANGRFVAVGGVTSEAVAVSSDAWTWHVAWTNGPRAEFRRLNGVAFGNNTFVAVGNGAAIFQSGQVGEHLELQTHPQNQTVAVGDTATLSVSATGPLPIQYQWQKESNDVQLATNASMVFDPALPQHAGLYSVRVSDGVDSLNTWSGKLFVPGALDLWEQTRSGSNSLASILWANGLFVAVGNSSNVLSSVDGKTWSSNNLGFRADLRALAFGNGIFVGVGAPDLVVTSSDGLAWARHSTGTNRSLSDVVFGGGLFAAIGLGWSNILTSSNGVTWTIQPAPAAPLDLTYANGMFVGTAGSNVVVSADGLEWSAYPVSPFFLTRITYGRGMFLALGRSNFFTGVFMSSNAVDWVFHRPPGVTFFLASSLSFHGGLFIAAPNASNNGITVSSDGFTWSTHTISGASNVLSVAFHDGRLAAVSGFGIFLSDYIGPPRFSHASRGANQVWLSAKGERGQSFRLQRADGPGSDDWTDLQTILFRSSSTNLSDLSATNSSGAYYRLAPP